MADKSKFWDRIAKRYIERPVQDPAAYARKLEATRALLRPDMTVLEIGSGSGTTALLHAPHVRAIHGIDISPKMVAHARDEARKAQIGNATFDVGTIGEFSRPDASHDMVLALSVLHLLDDWRATIRKVHGLLKPGGYFVSSTACMGGALTLLRPVMWLGSVFSLLPTAQFFSSGALLDAMRDAGFEIVESWQPDKSAAVFVIARKPAT